MATNLPAVSVAQDLAQKIAAVRHGSLPGAVRSKCEDLLVDIVGVCIAARNEDYVKATLAACDDEGSCTVIGQSRTLSAASAALVNGTAAHGEDFDDTFEGGPVHTGAVVVPAVLAACERYGKDGTAALLGIAVGCEVMCRLSTVIPKAVHRAGFHPTAVFGALGAAAGVGAALGLNQQQLTDALGVAGSMASGIIEYLAEGTWTKRMHAGWAAQSGLRAALLGREGFSGPRTVFEGVHGLFHGFAHSSQGNYAALTGDFPAHDPEKWAPLFGKDHAPTNKSRWLIETLAFKPYPCGTMAHPFIDCAKTLKSQGIKPADIKEMVCETAEGIVHRLWEPLADKQKPKNGYAAKFSIPYLLATGLVRGDVGFADFIDAAVRDPEVLAVAAKVKFVIDPKNPYPNAFTGHIRATLNDGRTIEVRQPHFRGGAQEPLTRDDIVAKFRLNVRYGGWSAQQGEAALKLIGTLYDGAMDLDLLRR